MASEHRGVPQGFYKTTVLIGLGFFTMGLMDPLYDAYVPIFLSDYLDNLFVVGSVMTLDNLLALLLIPVVSAWSDRTRSAIGRRMPFIVVTLPASALLFAAIPTAAFASLWALIAVVFALNIFKQAARGPVVALMPDTIPGEYRSEANGVINTMGGVAAIVGTIVLAPLMDVDIRLPILGDTLRRLPFWIAAALVIVATALLFLFVKERNQAQETDDRPSLFAALRTVFGGSDRSAVLILCALLMWFLGYQGVLPFVALYTRDVLGASEGMAGLSPGMVAVAYALFAIPSGIAGHRLGRKRVIQFALAAVVVIMIVLALHPLLLTGRGALSLYSFWALLFVFGLFWVTIITNSFPMLWQMANYSTMGLYTGLYYFFSQTAAISAPPLTGAVIDSLGFSGMFGFAALCFAGAWLLISRVRGTKAEA